MHSPSVDSGSSPLWYVEAVEELTEKVLKRRGWVYFLEHEDKHYKMYKWLQQLRAARSCNLCFALFCKNA